MSHCPGREQRGKSAYLWTAWPWWERPLWEHASCNSRSAVWPYSVKLIPICLSSPTFFGFLSNFFLSNSHVAQGFVFHSISLLFITKNYPQFGKMKERHFSLFLPSRTAKCPGQNILKKKNNRRH